MPNHIQNRLTITGNVREVTKLMRKISGKEEEEGNYIRIDFNNITPLPVELRETTEGSQGELALKLLFGKGRGNTFMTTEDMQKRISDMDNDRVIEEVKSALKYMANIKEHGHKSWYSWCNENWGTKWNAYEQDDDRNTKNTIYFCTAWSTPGAAIEELSKQFPKLELHLEWADEDCGSNTGDVIFKGGVIIENNSAADQSKEAYEKYFELNPGSEEQFHLVNGEYEYKDNE